MDMIDHLYPSPVCITNEEAKPDIPVLFINHPCTSCTDPEGRGTVEICNFYTYVMLTSNNYCL